MQDPAQRENCTDGGEISSSEPDRGGDKPLGDRGRAFTEPRKESEANDHRNSQNTAVERRVEQVLNHRGPARR